MSKHVILLVGPQGSGKTTFAMEHLPEYEYISQDVYGKTKHLERYNQLINNGCEKIVVDRINHTREQRARYLDIARENGYSTSIFVKSEKYTVCLDRILNREGHPTLPPDEEIVRKALNMFKRQYQRPSENEADEVRFIGNYHKQETDWYMLDLNKMKNKRIIVVGDVHGCYDELMQLLNDEVKMTSDDLVVLTGDLIDRGPKSKEVIDFVRDTPNVYSVLGNHDYKFLRYLRGNAVDVTWMQETLHSCKEYLENLEERVKLLDFFEELPYAIKLPANHYVVHAGINPKYPVETQNKEIVMYMRGIKEDGKMSKPFETEGVSLWQELYRGGQNILFGHQVTEEPIFQNQTIALDAGAVFGGKLRAYMYDHFDHEQNNYTVYEIDTPNYCEKDLTFEEQIFEVFPQHEALVEAGMLRRVVSPCNNLVAYNYTDKCTFKKEWNDITLNARGTVYDIKTGKVVARSFPKFFNYEELSTEKRAEILEWKNFTAMNKEDGSLGIVYNYNGEWMVNTRGSFLSDQAIKAKEMLKKYKIHDTLNRNDTYLVEIIYPENKIILDYGNEEKLVLLAAYDTETGEEIPRDLLKVISQYSLIPLVDTIQFESINHLISKQLILDHTNEGFVVENNGYRVKFKSKEYLKLARVLSRMTPLEFWREMENGKVKEEFLETIPEEMRDDTELLTEKLEKQYQDIRQEVVQDILNLPNECTLDTSYDFKEVGLEIKNNRDNYKHPNAIFCMIQNKEIPLDKYIMKTIRPTGNSLDR